MNDSASQVAGSPPATSLALILAGVVILVGSWTVPVNLKSLSPVLLREAGRGTPTLTNFGLQLVESEKPGPAAMILAAAEKVGDPGAPRLANALTAFGERQREFVAWGGWDPFLDPLFNLKENTGRTESTPVLTFFITGDARDSLRRYLAKSRSPGVQAMLQTRDITRMVRFTPANLPGGQPLDSVILLTALLYQGEHLSPSHQGWSFTLLCLVAVSPGFLQSAFIVCFFLHVIFSFFFVLVKFFPRPLKERKDTQLWGKDAVKQ